VATNKFAIPSPKGTKLCKYTHHWPQVIATPVAPSSLLPVDERKSTVQKPLVALRVVEIHYGARGLSAWIAAWQRQQPPATVSDITLTIQPGKTLALVGESGSGKSTIARTLAGLLPPIAAS
jgi:ABC-type glutathione transport system ATPase component